MIDDPQGLPGPGDLLAEEAVAVIRERTDLVPAVCVILGSGLGTALDGMEEEAAFAFEGLPGFPIPTVPGHAGRLLLGRFAGVDVVAFLGRVHFYEGHPISLCTLPVRLARLLGARTAVVTASVGALDPALGPGSLVVGVDHVNMMGANPLWGWRRPDGTPPFVDLVGAYDEALAGAAVEAAEAEGAVVRRGVYLAASGPSYETPAEIEFMRRAGGTVVGMSVVPEVVAARALGMRVLGLFSVTNSTGGGAVEHEEVVRMGREMGPLLGRVLTRVLPAAARH